MKRIALLAGRGRLPHILADEAKRRGEYIVALAINGITPADLEGHVDKIYWGEITETKRVLETLKSENIRGVVMTGKIPKSVIFDKRLARNEDASEIFKKTIDNKDYSLIKLVAARLGSLGIRVLDPTAYLSALIPKKGLITKRVPTEAEWQDIRFGWDAARKVAAMDIGQAVVVRRKHIVAVEAAEGTDAAIRRAAGLNGEGAVVVKVARPRQDMRFDVPTVGPETIDSMIAAKAAVLAVQARRTLLVDKPTIITKADSAGISVLAI